MNKLLAVLLCCLCSYATAAETKYWVQATEQWPTYMHNLEKGSWLSVDFENLTVRGEFIFRGKRAYYYINPETVGPTPTPQTVSFDEQTGTLTVLSFAGIYVDPKECRHVCQAWFNEDMFMSLVFNSDRTAFVSTSAMSNYYTTMGNKVPFELHSDPSNVPVPAAAWLFGSGLLGLVGVTRRSRRI